ncbi:MAG: anthranilate synthase component I, partial [Hydrogenothermaceae bacterium]
MSLNLDIQQFKELSKDYNVIPIYKEILLDIDTPLSVFLKIAQPDRFNFILESVEKADQKGRYSFIGSSENFYIRTKGEYFEVYNKGKIDYKITKDPIGELKNLLAGIKPVKDSNLPPFWGGYVGYVGYDVINFYEPVGDKNPDSFGIPDIYLFLSDEVIAFDNLKNSIKIIVSAFVENNPEEAFYSAVKKIDQIEEKLSKEIEIDRIPLKDTLKEPTDWKSNFTKEDFLNAVVKSKKYIE